MPGKKRTYFHSWIADTRNEDDPNISESSLRRLFEYDIGNPSKTNMEHAGCIAPDKIFTINKIKLSAYFSESFYIEKFIRSAILTLWVGDMPQLKMPARFCMKLKKNDDGIEGVTGYLDVESILIPPRQPLSAEVNIYDQRLENELNDMQKNKLKGYANIRVALQGTEVTKALRKLATEREAPHWCNPHPGDMHFNHDENRMYVFYEQGWKPMNEKVIHGRPLEGKWTPSSYLGKKKS